MPRVASAWERMIGVGSMMVLRASGSATCLLRSLLQREVVGQFAEAVVLLHDNLVFFPKQRNLHFAPGLAGETGPLDQFGDYVLLKLLGNATGTESERSGLVEHHQVPALVLQTNGVHSRLYRFLQHTDQFLKCPGGDVGVIWHDPSSSRLRLWPWPARPGPEGRPSCGPTWAGRRGPRPACSVEPGRKGGTAAPLE